ncbi:MAG: hypothetical protein J0H34_07660 [Rhizobiales bacterium]|nr:hypothetical protein [Hyphomicrobiales bacterium]
MVSLLTSLIGGVVSGEARLATRRAVRTAVFYLLAAVCVVMGVGFLIGAGYIEAARKFGARDAALGFGIGFLLLALLIYLIHLVAGRISARGARRRRTEEMKGVATAAAVALLPVLLRGKGALGLLAAPAALVAYAIYRENSRPRRDTQADEDDR